jgi:hypothetical protein
MTPQSSFMVVAPIDPRRDADLRRLLASMNHSPGRVDVNNALIPFREFDTLHFARVFVIDDTTLDDIRAHDLPPRNHPSYLAFLGDVDGDGDDFLREVAARAPAGLRELFSCCAGFDPDADLVPWMKRHSTPPAANYVNWRGRTVRRVREDAALYAALERYVDDNASALADLPPREVHARARAFVEAERAAGRLTLTPEPPTPPGWSFANLLHLLGIPLLLLVVSPVLIVVGAIVLLRVRGLEKRDPELCQRVDQAHSDALALIEDRDVTNQFSALGAVKPGLARLWTLSFVLLVIDYMARHVYVRGRLARVRTIHFARWVWLDGRRRVIFLSNYDASLEGYMDDFINKAGFGLNIAFSNGIGYPRTTWLVLDGCRDERKFKEYLRRHQLPTQVWYKAYPGLTAVDLERNALIREGVDAASLDESEARTWVSLL